MSYTEPSAAPGNVRITSSTTTFLEFAWDEIPCGFRGGAISYSITLNSTSPKTENTTDTAIILSGLDPCTSYKFTVKASNSQGDGDESCTIGDTQIDSKYQGSSNGKFKGRNENGKYSDK